MPLNWSNPLKKILFVCHGNICRSPAAEFIAKKYLKDIGRDSEFLIRSCAVSLEEIGNDIYPPMKRELYSKGIPFESRQAWRITQKDYDESDYIFYMDESNLRYLQRLLNPPYDKLIPINKYTKKIPYIEDPWYTERYSLVVSQISECIKDIFQNI